MISPVSLVSGYRVQAIYGDPVSTKKVEKIGTQEQANKALVTVSSREDLAKDPVTQVGRAVETQTTAKSSGVATGQEAEFLKQLEKLQTTSEDIATETEKTKKSLQQEDSLGQAVSKQATSSGKMSFSVTGAKTSDPMQAQIQNHVLQMGYQWNIREKVMPISA